MNGLAAIMILREQVLKMEIDVHILVTIRLKLPKNEKKCPDNAWLLTRPLGKLTMLLSGHRTGIF